MKKHLQPIGAIVCLILCLSSFSSAATLNIPPRPAGALKGSEFVNLVTSMTQDAREQNIYNQISIGNIPDFYRTLCAVTVTANLSGQDHTVIYYVTPDYLAIGSDDDYFLCPMTPTMAQQVADLLQCSLPTRKMVDAIWTQAAVKLAPAPIPPSAQMTTVPVFNQHNTMVWNQRQPVLSQFPLGALVGGDKKDVVITNRIYTAPAPPRVAIYGWHQLNGTPIQPLTTVHASTYADYSHGIRLANLKLLVDGQEKTIPEVLADSVLSALLSDEGVISTPRYPTPTPQPTPTPVSSNLVKNGSFEEGFTSGVGNNWTKWEAPGSSAITFGQASVNKHDGSYSQYWARSDTSLFNGGIYQKITVTPGTTYKISAWIKRQSLLTGTSMEFGYDLTGGTNGMSSSVVYTDLTGATDNVWVAYNATVTSTGGNITLFARAGHTGTAGGTNSYFYLDQIYMTIAEPTPTPPTPSSTQNTFWRMY